MVLENHGSCVLMLDQKLSTTEMTQMDGRVVAECDGELSPLMLNHGSKVSRYVIAGMQMKTEVSVEERLKLHSVLQLEN